MTKADRSTRKQNPVSFMSGTSPMPSRTIARTLRVSAVAFLGYPVRLQRVLGGLPMAHTQVEDYHPHTRLENVAFLRSGRGHEWKCCFGATVVLGVDDPYNGLSSATTPGGHQRSRAGLPRQTCTPSVDPTSAPEKDPEADG